jgi:phosphohistidine phosphatase
MRLIVVRHAHAEPGEPDGLRPLSARGRGEALALAERLADDAPTLVLSSPLLRARETAEPIAKAAGAELTIDERLSPGATGEDVLAVVAGIEGTVVTVGHQPDCSHVVEELGGVAVDFPTAGSYALDL